VWDDVIDVMSLAATRQALIDGTVVWIQFAQLWCPGTTGSAAGATTMDLWWHQVSIWYQRLLHILADAKTQQLVQDSNMMAFQQGMRMWADPHTTMALVEITTMYVMR